MSLLGNSRRKAFSITNEAAKMKEDLSSQGPLALHDLDEQEEVIFSSSNDNVSLFNQGSTDGGKNAEGRR